MGHYFLDRQYNLKYLIIIRDKYLPKIGHQRIGEFRTEILLDAQEFLTVYNAATALEKMEVGTFI